MSILLRVLIIGLLFAQMQINFTQSLRESSCIQPAGSQLSSCQLFSIWQTENGNPELVTAGTKYNIPLGSRIAANRMKTSYTRTLVHKNHPSGGSLFPGAGGLGQQLNSFLDSVEQLVEADYEQRFAQKKDNYFIAYFSRIQLTVLHELYQYLMSIYTAFNMTHINNIQEYLDNAANQALNKKTMIINHLVSIIEAQANQAIVMRFPNIPQHIATRMGPMMMQHDYGADLNLMIEGTEKELFDELETQEYYKKRREVYLDIFGKYLSFFKNYTATLNQEDQAFGTRFTRYAQEVQKVINANKPSIIKRGSMKAKIDALRTIKTINPPLFFYDEETLRSLRIIPKIAKDLPPNSQKVAWPKKLIEDARTGAPITDKFGNIISNQPRAYFLDKNGNVTRSSSGDVRLFVNIPTAQNMYSQQVKAQPDWLNSQEGVILMLRACLGDYTAVFDPLLKAEEIFDPCISCIILNAALKANIMGNQTTQACRDCQWYLEQIKNILKATAPEIPEAPPAPTGLP
ncbi:MAG: hypothetical protein WDZ41_03035 [Candidatus Babeliales bacterium]